jgi:hypothetical protein
MGASDYMTLPSPRAPDTPSENARSGNGAMNGVPADRPHRGPFRKVIHRDAAGRFSGADVYPPPDVRLARFGFRRVDGPHGKFAWSCNVTVADGLPAEQRLAWLDQLSGMPPLTFLAAYKLAKLAEPVTGVIRGTQAHLAGLIGINPRTLRAIIRALRRDGHLRTDRAALNTYTLITKRAGSDGSAASDLPGDEHRATGAASTERTSGSARRPNSPRQPAFLRSARVPRHELRPDLYPKHEQAAS